MNNHRILSKAEIEAACRPHTDRPITKWHTNADGTITAINDLGQKFIITVTYLDDLIETTPKPSPRRKHTTPPPLHLWRGGQGG